MFEPAGAGGTTLLPDLPDKEASLFQVGWVCGCCRHHWGTYYLVGQGGKEDHAKTQHCLSYISNRSTTLILRHPIQ